MPGTIEALIAGTASRRVFDHVLILMFENQYCGYVLGNPYMRRFARQGIQLGNFFGVMHPSQTNYIASIAGELCNVTSDDRPRLLAQRTIVDLIYEAPGRIRWKGYMESMCRTRRRGRRPSARRTRRLISSSTIPSRRSHRSCAARNGGGRSTTRLASSPTCFARRVAESP